MRRALRRIPRATNAARALRLRVKTAYRRLLDRNLPTALAAIPEGPVVDFGAKHGPYAHLLAGRTVWRVDINPAATPDLVADLRALPIRDGAVAGVICTQVLEHVPDPHLAAAELHRIAGRPSRTVVSAPFLYRYHADPDDFWRFTDSGLGHLFRDFDRTHVRSLGGIGQALYDLMVGPSILRRMVAAPGAWVIARGSTGSRNPGGFLLTADND